MGFSSLLDIVGSIIIGGILLTVLFRLSASNVENTYNNSGELTNQMSLTSTTQYIESDFRKIGYNQDYTKMPDPTTTITLADTEKIKFLSDVDKNGTVDTIYYYLGPTSELTSTPNPRDRMLYRVINGATPKSSSGGITRFRLVYFDDLGDTISTPVVDRGEIGSIEINLNIETTTPYNNEFSTVFWRQLRLSTRNIRNR